MLSENDRLEKTNTNRVLVVGRAACATGKPQVRGSWDGVVGNVPVAAVGAVVEVEDDLRLRATLGRIDVQFDLVLQISTGVSESVPCPTVEE